MGLPVFAVLAAFLALSLWASSGFAQPLPFLPDLDEETLQAILHQLTISYEFMAVFQ